MNRRIRPTFPIFFRTFYNSRGLARPIFVSTGVSWGKSVLGLTTPTTLRMGTISMGVQVFPHWEALAPFLSILMYLLIRVTSNTEKSLYTPGRFNSVFSATRKCINRMRLGGNFLNETFATFVTLSSNHLGLSTLRLQRTWPSFTKDHTGVPLMVAKAMTLAISHSLVLTDTSRFVHLIIRRNIRYFLCATTCGVLWVVLCGVLVGLCGVAERNLLPPCRFYIMAWLC